MNTRSWHYRFWRFATLAFERRSLTLPTKVTQFEYWFTVVCTPIVAVFWLIHKVGLFAILGLFYLLITLINSVSVWFGYLLSYRTVKFRRYPPLFRIYRQSVYPHHLLCLIGYLAIVVVSNYAMFHPEGDPWHETPFISLFALCLFNLILLLGGMALLERIRLGKRLNAYVRYLYRHLPTYSFEEESPPRTTT